MNTITSGHVQAFQFVRSPHYDNVTLTSCTINGEPGVAIVILDRIDEDHMGVMPLFVALTPSMEIDFPGYGRRSGGEGGGPTNPRETFQATASGVTVPAPR
jgi:hypothetical protein